MLALTITGLGSAEVEQTRLTKGDASKQVRPIQNMGRVCAASVDDAPEKTFIRVVDHSGADSRRADEQNTTATSKTTGSRV